MCVWRYRTTYSILKSTWASRTADTELDRMPNNIWDTYQVRHLREQAEAERASVREQGAYLDSLR